MFVVALTLGLVFGVLLGALLIAKLRLKLKFAGAAFVVIVILLLSVPLFREVTVGLSAGLLLGFVLVLIKPSPESDPAARP